MKESQNWYVRRGKELKGPFPSGLISRYILLGRIVPSDLVSHDRAEWLSVSQVRELMPEVLLNALANPGDEEAQRHLEAARRWADERRDLKGPPAPGAERRGDSGDSDARAVHYQREESSNGYRIGRRDYLIVALVVLALAAVPFLLPSGATKPSGPQCSAPAAPAVDWSSCRLEARQLANANLAGAKLRNTNLTGSILRAANLSGADVAYANLSFANLRGTNFNQATLKGASLRKADLTNANLTGSDLSYADLSTANLDGAMLDGAKLDNAIWSDGSVCQPGSVGQCLGNGAGQ